MKNLLRVETLIGVVVAATMASPAFAHYHHLPKCVPAPDAGMGLAALGMVGFGVRAMKRKFGK